MKTKEGTSSQAMMEPEQVVSDSSSFSSNSEGNGINAAKIETIPEKYYGAALKAHIATTVEPNPKQEQGSEPPAKNEKSLVLPLAIVGGAILLIAGGGFVYFNKDLIFGPSEPIASQDTGMDQNNEPPAPPSPPAPPTAPAGLFATSTAPTVVQLRWEDRSSNEAGFRIERREPTGSYESITSLPPNSTAYQDGSVSPETSYLYQVIAINEGGDSPASNEYSVVTPAEPPPPPEPEKLPPAGLDSDSDGLTDLEEPLYGTSPRDPDADRDTFLDGNEVFHLYNPAGGANVKLIESGLVKRVEGGAGWSIFVPSVWKATVSADGMSGVIDTGYGEQFRVSILDNAAHQSIMDWYLSRNPGILSSATAMIVTKGGLEGLEGADLLTTYFAWGDRIFVFTYQLNDQPFVNFRQTYEMMKNSLMLSREPNLPPLVYDASAIGGSSSGQEEGASQVNGGSSVDQAMGSSSNSSVQNNESSTNVDENDSSSGSAVTSGEGGSSGSATGDNESSVDTTNTTTGDASADTSDSTDSSSSVISGGGSGSSVDGTDTAPAEAVSDTQGVSEDGDIPLSEVSPPVPEVPTNVPVDEHAGQGTGEVILLPDPDADRDPPVDTASPPPEI